MKWRLLNTGPGDIYFNMALDEAIFFYRKRNSVPSTIRFYSWSTPAVTFGYFQQIDKVKEIFKVAGLPFARRITGGGSVLHCCDVTFSIACSYNKISCSSIYESYCNISKAVVSGLKNLGLEAHVSDGGSAKMQLCFSSVQPGDVTIKGRKLAGGAQRRSCGILLHQGSILLEQDEDFARFTRGGVSLIEAAGKRIAFSDVEKCIVQGFSEKFNVTLKKDGLSKQEIALANELTKKYKSQEWNNKY